MPDRTMPTTRRDPALAVVCVVAVLLSLLAATMTSTAAAASVRSGAPSLGVAPAEARSSAAAPGCRVLRQRLTRQQVRVRALESRLGVARAQGRRGEVRRVRAELRRAESRRTELRRKARLACDRTAPDTRLAGPADGAVVQASLVRYRVSSRATDVARYECSQDGGAWRVCDDYFGPAAYAGATPHGWSDPATAYGPHEVRVRAVDRSGNVDPTPARRTVTTRFYTALAAGGDRSCGLRPDGTISCWGEPFPGGARPPAGVYRFVDLGPGDHACAVTVGDAVVCWGADGSGQASPPPGTTVGPRDEVYVGRDHTCTPAVCWGDDTQGETAVPSGYRVAGAGVDFTCGHGGGPARCWGDGTDGRTAVPDGVVSIEAVGDTRACGFGAELPDNMRCWGRPFVERDPGLNVNYAHDVHLGGDHGCNDGESTFCWGADDHGQTTFPAGPEWLALFDDVDPFWGTVPGGSHTCALRVDGVTVCFGDGRAGQTTPAPA